jgi:DeoR/GlpR family transcriptional regulator of sugar metabolism
MKAEPRREQILKLLEKTGVLSVGELADRFALTEVTIRKDLEDLASEGLLERTFGGALFSNRSFFNKFLRESSLQRAEQKHAIASAALEYSQDGDTVILDAGTTTREPPWTEPDEV